MESTNSQTSIRVEVAEMFNQLYDDKISLSHVPPDSDEIEEPEPVDYLSSRLSFLTDDQNFTPTTYC